MSAMLFLRCAAPAFALIGAATVWAMAGPLAAALAFVIFILGVVTSELQHLRWSRVEEAGLPELPEAMEDGLAPAPALPAQAPQAAEPAEPAAPPPPARVPILQRHSFQCRCESLAIGSGRVRTGLAERTRRHAGRPPRTAAPAQRRAEPAAPLPAAASRPVEAHTLRFRAAYEARLSA